MRERLAGLVVRAYPDGAPAGELAGTALDVGAESPARFARELAGLTRAGLRERATRTAAVGPARLVFDGLCLAAVWIMTLELSVGLSQRIGRGMSDPLLAWPLMALLGGRTLPRAGRLRPRRRRRRPRLVGRALPGAGRRPRVGLGARRCRRDAAAVRAPGGALRRARRPPAPAPAGCSPPRLSRRPADAAGHVRPAQLRAVTAAARVRPRRHRARSPSSRSSRSRPTRASRSRVR